MNPIKLTIMNKLSQIFAAALISLSVNSYAGDCPILSGIYVIGKSETADFSSVNAAVTAAQCGGVTGNVTFRLETGTYEERVVISSIPGASAFNTVTFESKTGNNTDVIIRYPSSDATVVINGASYVSFENITIDHNAAVYGNAMRVDGNANNLHFKSVIFDGVEVARPGANSAAVYCTPTASKSNIAFEDCEINSGSVGIYKGAMSPDAGDSKTTISGTLFYNQYESAITLCNEDSPVITNNVISSLSPYNSFKGISLENISNGLIVNSNIIAIASSAVGIALNNCNAPASHVGQINSNSIAVGGKGAACGIQLSGNTDNLVLNFNRIKLSNGTSVANQSYYQNSGTGNNVNMTDNNFYDLKAGDYTIIGNSYKDMLNQLPAQSNASLAVSANGIMIEKVTEVK